MRKFLPLLLFVVINFLGSCAVKYDTLSSLISVDDNVSFDITSGDPFFKENYLVWFEQPIDHNNPEGGTFKQRVWLSHKNESAPVVMVTEGYSAPAAYKSELAELLDANQIVVEHRFFGESVPEDGVPWEYLTIEQAANDHHRVIEYFNKLYKQRWITTGISKGGQTAIIHRALYPKDVDVTVTYVAPYNLEREDKRLMSFFDSVGTEDQRRMIREFQIEILQRENEIMPYMEELVREKQLSFSMPLDKVIELAVLEYPFSLWQWCSSVPDKPASSFSAQELFDYLYKGIDFSYFSEQEAAVTGPFFYQAYTQLGYYSYNTSYLKNYLDYFHTDIVSNEFMVPKVDVEVVFDDSAINEITRRLHKADVEMIHIIGANDPWSSTTLDISDLKNSITVKDPNGCHLTRINNLPDYLKHKVLDTLKNWLD